jgi:hypothetical protein
MRCRPEYAAEDLRCSGVGVLQRRFGPKAKKPSAICTRGCASISSGVNLSNASFPRKHLFRHANSIRNRS